MPATEEARARLAEIPNLTVRTCVPLADYTRFGVGGPADVFAETADAGAFAAALEAARASGAPVMVLGGGANLIVADSGFRGVVLRYQAERLAADCCAVSADAGAPLQSLVDFTIARGLRGIETLSGVPGSVGGAVYGNAGAYGHSISECVAGVRFHDGAGIRRLAAAECGFRYRESIFKRNKAWVIFSVELTLEPGDAAELRQTADGILAVRNEKFPVTMKCAGSVFKNLLVNELPESARVELPPSAVREGKVPAAWFLERAGAKGLVRGGMRVAAYHANLIYNDGSGSSAELRGLIEELKSRVRDRFSLELEEEVQYVG
jgi:UDP-N-acetylmuramate dehydrogenase